MTDPANDLHAELSHRQMARDQAMASDQRVGQTVTVKQATIHGIKNVKGRITRIMPDGRLEVKITSPGLGGYEVLSQHEVVSFDEGMATDPPVSEPQRKAMHAAAEGHSTLGIPKKVGEEFVGKAHDGRWGGRAP
jgi:hypothetical protein